MKRLIFCTAIIVSFLSSCSLIGLEKVDREDLGLSPQSISVPQSGGTYTVSSKVSNLWLYPIRIFDSDGNTHKTNNESVIDEETKDTIGYDSEWVSVRKSVNETTGKCQLTIVVAENNTDEIRACLVSVMLGDSGGRITIRQAR